MKKKHVLYANLVIYIALAISIFIWFDFFFAYVRYLIGGMMLLYGVQSVLLTIIEKKKLLENFELYWAINEFLIGIVLLCCDIGEEPTYAVWAVWSILRETIEFKEQTSLWKQRIPTYISTIESLVVIALSVVLLATLAQHHARIHLVLLIIELVATAILPLVHEYLLDKRKQ